MKSYSVTIQMRPLQQYFHMTLFIFKYFTNEIWDLSWILILGTLGSGRVNQEGSTWGLPFLHSVYKIEENTTVFSLQRVTRIRLSTRESSYTVNLVRKCLQKLQNNILQKYAKARSLQENESSQREVVSTLF